MSSIEGWPYADHPKRGRDLQTRFTKADANLKRAEARMRRAFTAWEKARREFARVARRLEKGDE